jgi:hypothetical protein
MTKVRYFFLSMNVLNGLLAAVVAAGLLIPAGPLMNPAVISLPAVKETEVWPVEKAGELQSLAHIDYAVISEQNVFHPERKMPPDKQQEKAVSRPDVVLYGTLVSDDLSIAFVEDRKAPYTTAGRGKRQITLKKGGVLRGYTVTEIEADRIVLSREDDKFTVILDDKQKKRAGEQAAALPASQRAISGGTSPVQQDVTTHTKSAQAPAHAVTLPASGIEVSGSQNLPAAAPLSQLLPSKSSSSSFTQAESSSHAPGIGGSGTWPPTRSSVEQTRQKILEGRQKRLDQMQSGQ